jgi:polysaccharide export outer membrane protein
VVTSFVGPRDAQIRVIGEATRPQILAFRKGMSLLDVMIAVGGLTDFADGNHASIYRADDGGGKSYSVRLQDLVKRGDVTANVDMRPGDILIIPQSWF